MEAVEAQGFYFQSEDGNEMSSLESIGDLRSYGEREKFFKMRGSNGYLYTVRIREEHYQPWKAKP